MNQHSFTLRHWSDSVVPVDAPCRTTLFAHQKEAKAVYSDNDELVHAEAIILPF